MATIDENARQKKVAGFEPFRAFVKGSATKILRRKYRLRVQNWEIMDQFDPPYVYLPNHMTFWDPFYMGDLVNTAHIHYLASDDHFRNFWKRTALRLLGVIAKTKQRSDLEAIKNIMRVKQMGDVIGLFPEGTRTWDGHTLPLVYATAKLVRMLRLPVLIAIQKGGFLSRPRWTKNDRRGRIDVEFKVGFTVDELASMSTEEIFERMTRLLAYDEYVWQRENMVPFKGKNRAENVELVLFLCPQCQTIGSLRSKHDDLTCQACKYSVYYNEYGFFEKRSDTFFHDSVYAWNKWQLGFLKDLLATGLQQKENQPVFTDTGINLSTGTKHTPLVHLRYGSAVLYLDRIEFHAEEKEPLIFPMEQVESINVQDNERLDFYVGDTMYRFTPTDRSTSAFKWMRAVEQLHELRSPPAQQKAP